MRQNARVGADALGILRSDFAALILSEKRASGMKPTRVLFQLLLVLNYGDLVVTQAKSFSGCVRGGMCWVISGIEHVCKGIFDISDEHT